jgi:hypothetical protein
MLERALKCPQCKAPLPPSGFARSVVCPFCGSTVLLGDDSIPIEGFREALLAWNDPASQGYANVVSIVNRNWAIGRLVAHGEVSDVYTARRARWPTENALLKVLRESHEAAPFHHEWRVLLQLQASTAAGAERFTQRMPQPILQAAVKGGTLAGSPAMLLRWAPGFTHTFESVRRHFPRGIEPRASIWIWRRILEALTFIHASGFVHGAVLPPHLLIEDGEHGVRLVGFRNAGRLGGEPSPPSPAFASMYPRGLMQLGRLTPALDIAMSARCIAFVLGGDAATGEVPSAVPAPLAAEIARAAAGDTTGITGITGGPDAAASAPGTAGADAWALSERLGALARQVYGPPSFCPLTLPEEV